MSEEAQQSVVDVEPGFVRLVGEYVVQQAQKQGSNPLRRLRSERQNGTPRRRRGDWRVGKAIVLGLRA